MKVLKECIRLKPDDAAIPLLAAKLCVGSLHWVSAREPCSLIWVEREPQESLAAHKQGCSSPGPLAWASGLLGP